MTIDTSFIDRLKQLFYPSVRDNRIVEPDATINMVAIERIKRSPGHQNLNELAEEPEWYHD